MLLYNWAVRWGINPEAFKELQALMGVEPAAPPVNAPQGSEARAQQDIRLEASKRGDRLWRNNRGATFDERGHMVRYGLANESKAIDKQIKSSDLIGITRYLVQPEDVGKTVGIFTSIEVKKSGWVYKGTERELAQLKWIELVISLGGYGRFSTGV